MGEPLSLEQVAQSLPHMSPFYFCKVFKAAIGLTFTDYLARARVEKTKQLLLNQHTRASEAAYEAGFQSLSPVQPRVPPGRGRVAFVLPRESPRCDFGCSPPQPLCICRLIGQKTHSPRQPLRSHQFPLRIDSRKIQPKHRPCPSSLSPSSSASACFFLRCLLSPRTIAGPCQQGGARLDRP